MLIMIFLLCLIFPALSLSQSVETSAGTESESPPLPDLTALFEGRIVLQGQITNPDGQPLSGITATLEASYLNTHSIDEVKWNSLLREQREFDLEDPDFRFECEGCLALEVVFRKAGYRSARINAELTTLSDDRELEDTHIEKRDQQIILRPSEHFLPRLDRVMGQLIFRSNGNHQVILTSDAAPRTVISLQDLRRRAAAGERQPYVQLLTRDYRPGMASSDFVLQQAIVDFSHAAGGLIAYTLDEPDKNWEAEMSEAPLQGYNTTLTLEADREDPLYFFCHLGFQYCRGSISPPHVEITQQGLRVVANLELVINRDNDRQLYIE